MGERDNDRFKETRKLRIKGGLIDVYEEEDVVVAVVVIIAAIVDDIIDKSSIRWK